MSQESLKTARLARHSSSETHNHKGADMSMTAQRANVLKNAARIERADVAELQQREEFLRDPNSIENQDKLARFIASAERAEAKAAAAFDELAEQGI